MASSSGKRATNYSQNKIPTSKFSLISCAAFNFLSSALEIIKLENILFSFYRNFRKGYCDVHRKKKHVTDHDFNQSYGTFHYLYICK